MYTADMLGANTPEAKARFNKIVQTAQQSRNPIQTFTNGYQAPSFFNAFSGNSSGGGTAPTFSGMPNFKGIYDFGGGNKYDYGKGQWVTTPAPSSGSGSSGSSNNSKKP